MPATSPSTIAVHANSFPDFTGIKVNGRYELVDFLGSGTFGVVYKAIDHNTDCQLVAMKILRKAGRTDAQLAVVKREVAMHDLASDIKGVVRLIDAFDDHEWCYMVLEFCPGGDLFGQIVDKECYFDNDDLLRTAFLSLVDAVQACHDAEIAHRDLKPENILTSEDGSELYLADFGLASNEKMVREFGSGTHIYMSPECVGEMTSMQPYDPFLSDIWALGVVLINMISASHPWTQATSTDVQFRQFLKDPDFLYRAFPMSTGAQNIIRDTLRLHPAQRISLRGLREAIVSLDTFLRPVSELQYGLDEDAQPTATPGCWASLFPARPNSVPESTSNVFAIDLLCATSKTTVQVARHRSAGSAFNTPDVKAQSRSDTPTFGSCLCRLWSCSCSSSRTPSDMSSEEDLVTPDGSAGAIVVPSNLKMWEQMMMEAYDADVRGDHEQWRTVSVPGVLMARARSN